MDAITQAHDRDIQMIESAIVRVHQHGAAAERGPDRCLGRSRGGLTTRIHALVDKRGRPIKLKLTAGRESDITSGPQMVAEIKEGPRSWPTRATTPTA